MHYITISIFITLFSVSSLAQTTFSGGQISSGKITSSDSLNSSQDSLIDGKYTFKEVLNEKNVTENNVTKRMEKEKYNQIKNLISNKIPKQEITIELEENNNFYVKTLNDVIINGEIFGYLMVTEQANEILVAVDERRNFISNYVNF